MNILEKIELRLYRYVSSVKLGCDAVTEAKKMAVEILNLTTENSNTLKSLNHADKVS